MVLRKKVARFNVTRLDFEVKTKITQLNIMPPNNLKYPKGPVSTSRFCLSASDFFN